MKNDDGDMGEPMLTALATGRQPLPPVVLECQDLREQLKVASRRVEDLTRENARNATENAALREANARAAERIREEQKRTERLVEILRKWNRLCEMGLMDVTKEWVRPTIMELWELTDEALPSEPDQVPTEHTEDTEAGQATTKDTKHTKGEAP
jgi:hypothetical protein